MQTELKGAELEFYYSNNVTPSLASNTEPVAPKIEGVRTDIDDLPPEIDLNYPGLSPEDIQVLKNEFSVTTQTLNTLLSHGVNMDDLYDVLEIRSGFSEG